MDFLELSPDVGFCRIGDEAVFLDLRRDRYFRLTGEVANLLWRLVSAPNEPVEYSWSERLVRTGLLRPCSRPGSVSPTRATAIERSLVEQSDHGALSLSLVPALALAVVQVRRRLGRGELRQLVVEHRSASRLDSPLTDQAAERWAVKFLAARPLVPVRPSCLLDSLVLSRLLRRRGVAATLVFGVKLAPFAAHCWLERGGTILNDSIDNAAEFTPVLAL